MTYKIYPEQDVEAIAEAIRNKNGLTNKYKIGEMAEAINNLGIYSLSGEDNAPYLYRKTPLTSDAELDKIVGGSVVENQLVQNGNFADGTNNWTASGGTTFITDGECEITLTTDSCQFYQNVTQKVEGHKIFVSFNGHASNTIRIGVLWGNTLAPNISISTAKTHINFIGNVGSGNNNLNFISTGATGDKVYLSNIQLIDLTQMFGTTIADYVYQLEQSTAGSGVAYLKSLGFFTDDYYPYNSGEIKSVSGLSSHDMTGRNLLHVDSRVNQTTASVQYTSDDNFVIMNGTKNGGGFANLSALTITLPKGTYYAKAFEISGTASNNISVYPFDGNADVVGNIMSAEKSFMLSEEKTFYFRFAVWNDGTVFSNYKIGIVISKISNIAEYSSYQKHSYPLDSTLTLRGIPKLSDGKIYYDGDVYNSDGSVTRKYGVVDLGSLNWSLNTSYPIFYAPLTGSKTSSEQISTNILSIPYSAENAAWYQIGNKHMVLSKGLQIANVNSICVHDDTYTSAADFKSAMQGVYLIYELAEPTTETAEPYSTIQICDGAGTEEYVTTGIPVGHETKYLELIEN